MPKHIPYADTGEYRLLYKYLRDRFADRVVLTFGQIEDLVGFSLPSGAWLQHEWWNVASPAAHESEPSASWTLADRTASVNLSARTVAFERNSSLSD
jgi:hypothetical protein